MFGVELWLSIISDGNFMVADRDILCSFPRPKIPSYELVFVDLKPFVEQDIDNFCKGLAFLKKSF